MGYRKAISKFPLVVNAKKARSKHEQAIRKLVLKYKRLAKPYSQQTN